MSTSPAVEPAFDGTGHAPTFTRHPNITPERLRFDFSFSRALTKEEVQKVEDLVNEQIARDLSVTKEEMSLDDAKDTGARALFGDKYGERVTVYSIGDFSKEVCAGPHVEHTAQIGQFKITKEQSSIFRPE